MASTNASSHRERPSSDQSTTSTPSLLGLPVELRDIIYSHVIFQPPWPPEGFTRCSCHDPLGQVARCAAHCPNPLRGRLAYRAPLNKLTQKRPVYLAPSKTTASEFQLLYSSPLSFANKQLREDFSRFLHTAPLNVVARAYDFDFRHIVQFLSRLGGTHQDDFRVRRDGTSARKLIIELHGPYTESYMDNMHQWLKQAHTFAGPEEEAELATLYRIPMACPPMICDMDAINPLVKVDANLNEGMAPGGGKTEAGKIAFTINASDALHTHYRWWLGPSSVSSPRLQRLYPLSDSTCGRDLPSVRVHSETAAGFTIWPCNCVVVSSRSEDQGHKSVSRRCLPCGLHMRFMHS